MQTMNKDQIINLLKSELEEISREDESTWQDSDEGTVSFDKGWQSGMVYAIQLISENYDEV
jgi:hypothetical protein